MIHACKTIPLGQLSDARAKTMCDTCKARDCDNPIENREVSIVGVCKKMRVYVAKSSVGIVVQCDGFNP